jgi:hypothetical protein
MEVFQITIARHFMATTHVLPQDGALLPTQRPNAGGWRQTGQANRRRLAVHDADFSPERIVALPEGDDDRHRIRRYGSAGLETLTSSKSS